MMILGSLIIYFVKKSGKKKGEAKGNVASLEKREAIPEHINRYFSSKEN